MRARKRAGNRRRTATAGLMSCGALLALLVGTLPAAAAPAGRA
ncbi:hypothetical protein ACFWVP_08465 [Streptomyces sp. NPDC058637]